MHRASKQSAIVTYIHFARKCRFFIFVELKFPESKEGMSYCLATFLRSSSQRLISGLNAKIRLRCINECKASRMTF